MTNMKTKTKNLINMQFGEWTVISFYGYVKNSTGGGNATWNCKCSCGFEKFVMAQYLLNGSSTKCRSCADKRGCIENEMPPYIWKNILSNASKRKIKLNVTKEECFNLLQKQNFKCKLSGLDIYLSKCAAEHLENKTTASLDRIDNLKGYLIDNIQWVHKDINLMKRTLTEEHFIKLCNDVVNHSFSS